MRDILDDISPESTRKYTKLDYSNYYYTGRKGPSPNLNAGQRQRRGGRGLPTRIWEEPRERVGENKCDKEESIVLKSLTESIHHLFCKSSVFRGTFIL
jgi:hypothetical protein